MEKTFAMGADDEEQKEKYSNSMDMAMNNSLIVSRIVAHLENPRDLHSACQVSKTWDNVVSWTNRRLTVKSHTLIPNLVKRFRHIRRVNLSQLCDQIEDADLLLLSTHMKSVTDFTLGSMEEVQKRITNRGFIDFVQNLTSLEQVTLSFLPNLEHSAIEALTSVCTKLRVLSIEECRGLTDKALDCLRCCNNLEELSLKWGIEFTTSGLANIGECCPSLQRLFLDCDYLDIGAAMASVARRCKNLQQLRLRFLHGDLANLAGITSLISLYICTNDYVNVHSTLVRVVCSNKSLKEFTYFNIRCSLSDSALMAIVGCCKNLEKLCLMASNLTDMGLVCVRELKGLICLELGHFYSNGQALAAIGGGVGLKELSLRSAKEIMDVELETMMYSNCASFERIDLQSCSGPTSRGFSSIGLCVNLEKLDLSFTAVDDVGLATIAAGCSSKLRQLSLVKCNNVCNMLVLSRFPALEHLNVDQCEFVTDEGFDFVAATCTKLTHVSMVSTRVTDTGLEYLAACSMLRTLKVSYCKGVQGNGLLVIAARCDWIEYIVVSHRLNDSIAVDELRKKHCMVSYEFDDMALVPFGLYMR